MSRKITFALVTTAALCVAALAPTSASARGGHGGGFHGGIHRGVHGGERHGWNHRGFGYHSWGHRDYGGGGGPGWCFYHPRRCQ